jgi:hypothetical protein
VRITENKLRSLIRQIIKESSSITKYNTKEKFFEEMERELKNNFPIKDDQYFNINMSPNTGVFVKINGEDLSNLTKEVYNDPGHFHKFINFLYEEHTKSENPIEFKECVNDAISYLEGFDLKTKSLYDARESSKKIIDLENKKKIDSFRKAFFGNKYNKFGNRIDK